MLPLLLLLPLPPSPLMLTWQLALASVSSASLEKYKEEEKGISEKENIHSLKKIRVWSDCHQKEHKVAVAFYPYNVFACVGPNLNASTLTEIPGQLSHRDKWKFHEIMKSGKNKIEKNQFKTSSTHSSRRIDSR